MNDGYYTSELYAKVEAYVASHEAGEDTLPTLQRLFEEYGHAVVHSAIRTYMTLRRD